MSHSHFSPCSAYQGSPRGKALLLRTCPETGLGSGPPLCSWSLLTSCSPPSSSFIASISNPRWSQDQMSLALLCVEALVGTGRPHVLSSSVLCYIFPHQGPGNPTRAGCLRPLPCASCASAIFVYAFPPGAGCLSSLGAPLPALLTPGHRAPSGHIEFTVAVLRTSTWRLGGEGRYGV